MPFVKTYEVINEFFQVFLKHTTEKQIPGDNRLHPMLPIPIFGEDRDFLVRYYKRSGDGGVEDIYNFYPCIVIQDFTPEIIKSRVFGMHTVDGFYDQISKKVEVITLPIPMLFRFQVSSFALSHKEILGCNDWFNLNFNFSAPDCLLMNQLQTAEGVIGDVVPYKISMSEGDVDDGRFSTNYTFDLETYVHAKFKDYYVDPNSGVVGGNFEDTIQKLTLNLYQKDVIGFERELLKSFTFE